VCSRGYKLLVSSGFRWFGMAGIGIIGVLLTLAVAYSIFSNVAPPVRLSSPFFARFRAVR